MKKIPLSIPVLSGHEWEHVKECFDTNWVSTAGPYVEKFERLCAETVGRKHAVATVNGTAALHLAFLAANIEKDTEVILPSLTFIASANAVRYAGAVPTFVDCENEFLQLDVNQVERFLRQACEKKGSQVVNKRTQRRVSAILPVHALGHSVDMDPLRKLADEFGLTIIEDAAEALGARYKGAPVGQHGEITCLSFNGNKIITCGGGGMLLTDSDEIAKRARHLSTQAKAGADTYVHDEVGYNYRLTNILAAFGVAQMDVLEKHVKAKIEIAKRYQALSDVSGIETMKSPEWSESSYWMYTIRLTEGSSEELCRSLESEGIQSRRLWQPLHQSEAHSGSFSLECPNSVKAYEQCLSIPCSPDLTQQDQQRVIDAIASWNRKRLAA